MGLNGFEYAGKVESHSRKLVLSQFVSAQTCYIVELCFGIIRYIERTGWYIFSPSLELYLAIYSHPMAPITMEIGDPKL